MAGCRGSAPAVLVSFTSDLLDGVLPERRRMSRARPCACRKPHLYCKPGGRQSDAARPRYPCQLAGRSYQCMMATLLRSATRTRAAISNVAVAALAPAACVERG